MLEGTARKMADGFFAALAARLADAPVADTGPVAPAEPALPPASLVHPAAKHFPETIKVEFGELRIVTKTPWMTFAAIFGWLAAAGLAWRLYH